MVPLRNKSSRWLEILIVGAAAFSISRVARADTITTSQQPATATVGSSIADMATVTGLVSPASFDTVTFMLYNNASATGTPLFTDTEIVSLDGGTATATSSGYTTSETGTDYWVDTFNGDQNNLAVTNPPASEPVTVTPAFAPVPEPGYFLLLASVLLGLIGVRGMRCNGNHPETLDGVAATPFRRHGVVDVNT